MVADLDLDLEPRLRVGVGLRDEPPDAPLAVGEEQSIEPQHERLAAGPQPAQRAQITRRLIRDRGLLGAANAPGDPRVDPEAKLGRRAHGHLTVAARTGRIRPCGGDGRGGCGRRDEGRRESDRRRRDSGEGGERRPRTHGVYSAERSISAIEV